MNSLGSTVLPVTEGTNPEPAENWHSAQQGTSMSWEPSSAWPHTLLTHRAGQRPPRYLLVPFQTSQQAAQHTLAT